MKLSPPKARSLHAISHDEYRSIPEEDENELCEILRSIMRTCYRSLEKEFEWATGDGAREFLSDSDYYFNKEGDDYCEK